MSEDEIPYTITPEEEEIVTALRVRDEAAAAAQGDDTAWSRIFTLLAKHDGQRSEYVAMQEVIRDLATVTLHRAIDHYGDPIETQDLNMLRRLIGEARTLAARWDTQYDLPVVQPAPDSVRTQNPLDT
jgi:hypothetical protein